MSARKPWWSKLVTFSVVTTVLTAAGATAVAAILEIKRHEMERKALESQYMDNTTIPSEWTED